MTVKWDFYHVTLISTLSKTTAERLVKREEGLRQREKLRLKKEGD